MTTVFSLAKAMSRDYGMLGNLVYLLPKNLLALVGLVCILVGLVLLVLLWSRGRRALDVLSLGLMALTVIGCVVYLYGQLG